MYKLIGTCKVLPKVIMAVQELRCDMSICSQLRLHDSQTRFCNSLAEDQHITWSDKTLATTKEGQLIYKPVRYKHVNHDDDDSTDSSDSDGNDYFEARLKAMAVAEEEVQTQREILAKYKDGELYRYNPSIEYEQLKRYYVPRIFLTEDFSSDSSDSESDTK